MVELPRLGAKDTVVVDFETRDPLLLSHGPSWVYKNRAGGHICGVALAWGRREDDAVYLSTRHPDSPNLDEGVVSRYLRAVVRSGATLIMHNALYDRGWATTWGITEQDWIHGWEDTQTLAALAYEYRRSYSLESLAKVYGVQHKRSDILEQYCREQGWKGNPGQHIWRMPSSVVGPYAAGDGTSTWQLFAKLQPVMKHEEWEDAYRREIQLQDVLLAMRARGVRVDEQGIEDAHRQLRVTVEDGLHRLRKMVGFDVNIASGASMGKACDKLGLSYNRTPTGLPSFRAPWMKTQQHEFFKIVLDTRQADKADGTFVMGLKSKVMDGRVHGQLHPLRSDEGGAVTGRFSSTDPNLQNQPSKVPHLKRLIRGLFLPDKDELWCASDYSQQEPRMAVHFAVRCRVAGAKAAQRLYQENIRTDFHTMVVELCGGIITRDKAKILNLAMMYGQGEASTCHALGFPTEWIEVNKRDSKGEWIMGDDGKPVTEPREIAGEEGKAFIAHYHDKVPFVRGLDMHCRRIAQQRKDEAGHGFIKTLWKRRCRFAEGIAWPYQAMNRLVQGSSADQTKQAMINLHKAGFKLLVTVHDEVGLSVTDLPEAYAAARVMEQCVQLEVPSVCDVEVGPSWGAAELPDDENEPAPVPLPSDDQSLVDSPFSDRAAKRVEHPRKQSRRPRING